MKAKKANYADVAQLTKLCQRLHVTSSWRDLQFNPTLVRKNLAKVIHEDGMDVLAVRNDEGEFTGILLATVEQFFVSKELYATDVHFMCESGGIELMTEFKRWAKDKGASRIIMGIANDDPGGRIAAFYKWAGMKKVGDAWVLDLKELEEQAA